MKRTPRQTRGRLWAWVYLAIFGTDTDDTDEEGAESSSEAEPDDERDDAPVPEE